MQNKFINSVVWKQFCNQFQFYWKSLWFSVCIGQRKSNLPVWAIHTLPFANRFPRCSDAANTWARRRYTSLFLPIFQTAQKIVSSDGSERYQRPELSVSPDIGKNHWWTALKIRHWYFLPIGKWSPHYRVERCRTDWPFYRALGKISIFFPVSCQAYGKTGVIEKVDSSAK